MQHPDLTLNFGYGLAHLESVDVLQQPGLGLGGGRLAAWIPAAAEEGGITPRLAAVLITKQLTGNCK